MIEKMKTMTKRGYVLFLVIFTAISLAFFVISVGSMNRGFRSQVTHTKQMQQSFQIAYSGFQQVVGRLFLKPWEERFCRAGPVAESGFSLYGGTYETYVVDVAAVPNQVDIYIRVRLEGTVRSYVWRIEHIPSLLDSAYYRTIYFGEPPVESFPSGSTPSYSQTITDLVNKRKLNQPMAEDARAKIAGVNTVKDVAVVLGAPAPVIPASNSLPIDHPAAAAPTVTVPGVAAPPAADSFVTDPKAKQPHRTSTEITNILGKSGRVRLPRVNFVPESNQILPDSFPALEEILIVMKDAPNAKFVIEGHVANPPGEDIPGRAQALSDQRAQAVVDWLVSRGVSSSRLQAVGKGNTVAIASNATDEGRRRNRRVEVVRLP